MTLTPSDSPYSEYLNPGQYEPPKVEYVNQQYDQNQQYTYPPSSYPQSQLYNQGTPYPPNVQYAYGYQQPMNQTIPSDVMPYNYPTNQPVEQETNDHGTVCCLAFLSYLIPLVGWILGCTLTNKRHATICTRVATISFIFNIVCLLVFGLMPLW